MTAPTDDQIAAFLARVDPTKVGRVDRPEGGAVAERTFGAPVGRTFTAQALRPSAADWRAFAVANAADPVCADDPLYMTVRRDGAGKTTVTVYWSAKS